MVSIIDRINSLEEWQTFFNFKISSKSLSISEEKELVKFIDNNIIMRSYLDHSDEFMEKLYFIRYYYNIGKKFI